MSDPTPLLFAADRLADRFRSMPQGRLTQLAPEGLRLARLLARQEEAVAAEGPARPEIPDAGIFAVGDQIALAAHDLAEALRGADREEAEAVLAEALAAVEQGYRLATTRSARM
ncbi:hypothetical protein [Streptacidiphilus carbonis]|jgi:hypothetical protein|uniref:hypothetical protein n=1 Tax=Streptacidiphilus carbonis TaxID=105422 RepID=UPI0005AA5CD7|nr:hypothetical protein [Streptacidiphilus carbonis]